MQTVIDELVMTQYGQALRIKNLDVAQSKGVPTLEFLPRKALTGSHSEDGKNLVILLAGGRLKTSHFEMY